MMKTTRMKTTSKNARAPWRRAIMVASVALIALLAGGCDIIPFGRGAEDDAEPEEPTFAVAADEAGTETIVDSIRVNGDLESAATVDVFPDAFGDVHELNVRVGQQVSRDEVIARIDQSRPGQSFQPSPVRAPISGTITSIPVRVGSKVQQGQPVARMATTGELELRTHVAERYIGRLELGQSAEVQLAAFPGETFAARVIELSPVVDPATRTMEVKLEFESPDARLRPGMFARVRIITEEREGVTVVSPDAVVTRLGRQYVFVIDEDERVEQREVELGIQSAEYIEIRSGVAPGERVVVQGQNQLEDGVRVRLVDEDEQQAEAAGA